ncbi:MAG: GNAT family N-acetyltransferase [Actinomycetota bacterium]
MRLPAKEGTRGVLNGRCGCLAFEPCPRSSRCRGECGLTLLPPRQASQPSDAATISSVSRRNQWGRGYATEAARALLMFAFAELGPTSVFGGCHPDNVGSRLVMEHVGLSFQGADGSFPGS